MSFILHQNEKLRRQMDVSEAGTFLFMRFGFYIDYPHLHGRINPVPLFIIGTSQIKPTSGIDEVPDVRSLKFRETIFPFLYK